MPKRFDVKSLEERNKALPKIVFGLGVVIVVVLLVGVSLLLYTTAKVQQGLLNREPEYPASQLYSKALDQISKEDFASAEKYLEEALLKEEDATYRNQLAVVKYRLKKYPEAIEQYRKLIDQKQDEGFAWNGIGNAQRDWAETDKARASQHYKEAEEAYRTAIKTSPNYVSSYSNLALMLHSQEKTAEAVAVLDQGINVTQQNVLKDVKATIQAQKK